MIKHASEDIGDENRQHYENNETNKIKNSKGNNNNHDRNENEADLNSVTSQGSGDNNFQFNFSDVRAGKHKMSVYDVSGDDNKPHSHNKKHHSRSHRKRSSTNNNRMAHTCHNKYYRKHYPKSVNKLNETGDGGGIRSSQKKLDELDNMQSGTGGKGDVVDDTTSKRIRRRSNPRNIDGEHGGKDEASDSDDFNRRGGSHSSEEDRLGIEPRQSDGNKSKNELSVNINDIDLMASFGEEICSTCSDNMSDNNNDSDSSATTIIANNNTDTDDNDIEYGIFTKIPYYCWLKPRPPPRQEPENDNGRAVHAMVRRLQEIYGNGAHTANNTNNNNNKASNGAKRRRNTTTSSTGSSHTSRPSPASMIQRYNSAGNNSISNNASSLSQKSRDMLTATEFFREINRKFENGRTVSFSGSNGNRNGNGNNNGYKGNNGRIGGVRSYSLVDHTSTTVTNLKAPNYAILQPGNNTSASVLPIQITESRHIISPRLDFYRKIVNYFANSIKSKNISSHIKSSSIKPMNNINCHSGFSNIIGNTLCYGVFYELIITMYSLNLQNEMMFVKLIKFYQFTFNFGIYLLCYPFHKHHMQPNYYLREYFNYQDNIFPNTVTIKEFS